MLAEWDDCDPLGAPDICEDDMFSADEIAMAEDLRSAHDDGPWEVASREDENSKTWFQRGYNPTTTSTSANKIGHPSDQNENSTSRISPISPIKPEISPTRMGYNQSRFGLNQSIQ